MKKNDFVIREYASKLPFDTLRYLCERFKERIGPDLAEAIEVLSKSVEMDKILSSARDADEFFNAVDMIAFFVEKEYGRRNPDFVGV
jgi:hypothetical protein